MEEMFIVPLSPVRFQDELDTTRQSVVSGNAGVNAFRDLFQNMMSQASDAEAEYANQQYLLATGQIEDVHTVTIAGAYAQLSVDLLVNMRNKALESYNELIRLTV